MTPGSNLLAQALTVIAPQLAQYWAATGREVNTVGIYVTSFAEPVDVYGSIQPVPRALYEKYGLDFNKNYVTFYTTRAIDDVFRGRSGDQLTFGGKRWQVESSNDWQFVDGWNGLLCIEVTADD
ncbi:MAG: phage collar protein [Methylocystis sp.]|uniref:phage collar protein n=1 Tax=Methylocystis sp. TaxID=1911079 RepID=UPI003DA30C08